MGHTVTAIVAKSPVAAHLVTAHGLVSVKLVNDLRLVPLEDDDLDSLGMDFSKTTTGFNYLSPEFVEFCEEVSVLGPLVYLETDYFGGMGSQAAAAFSGGSLVATAPLTGEEAINTALRSIGVVASSGLDEFDSIGLSRYRYTSDWKEAATR